MSSLILLDSREKVFLDEIVFSREEVVIRDMLLKNGRKSCNAFFFFTMIRAI